MGNAQGVEVHQAIEMPLVEEGLEQPIELQACGGCLECRDALARGTPSVHSHSCVVRRRPWAWPVVTTADAAAMVLGDCGLPFQQHVQVVPAGPMAVFESNRRLLLGLLAFSKQQALYENLGREHAHSFDLDLAMADPTFGPFAEHLILCSARHAEELVEQLEPGLRAQHVQIIQNIENVGGPHQDGSGSGGVRVITRVSPTGDSHGCLGFGLSAVNAGAGVLINMDDVTLVGSKTVLGKTTGVGVSNKLYHQVLVRQPGNYTVMVEVGTAVMDTFLESLLRRRAGLPRWPPRARPTARPTSPFGSARRRRPPRARLRLASRWLAATPGRPRAKPAA